MSDHTHIEWTDATWNPITGCSVVSAGCKHCYAMRLAGTRLRHHPSRAGLTRPTAAGPVWTGDVRFNADWLDQPLRWKKPRRIFVCAHGDLFHEAVPGEWIDRVFAVMALAPQHTFQVLTKRPERLRDHLTAPDAPNRIHAAIVNHIKASVRTNIAALNRAADWLYAHLPNGDGFMRSWPLHNVWLGVSVENQATADERIPLLLQTPAAVRFISAEPLLGAVDLASSLPIETIGGVEMEAWLDWVIAGAESGPGARPSHPDWFRALRDQCQAADVPFFFKQWGGWWPINQMADSDALYKPAPEHDPEASRICTVEYSVLHHDGQQYGLLNREAFEQKSSPMQVFRVGKRRAGRLLDGREWNEFPAVAP